LAVEREVGAEADLALAGMMPPGDKRQQVVQEWLTAVMPWVDLESTSSEEFLIGRWKERFGDTEDGQQPK